MIGKHIIHSVENIAKHNMKYIDRIDITIYNPKTVLKGSILRNSIYNASVFFYKDHLNVRKDLSNDIFEDLINDINITINSEIKI